MAKYPRIFSRFLPYSKPAMQQGASQKLMPGRQVVAAQQGFQHRFGLAWRQVQGFGGLRGGLPEGEQTHQAAF